MDHPRSRGVYSDRWRGRRASRGSSPLARGLLGSRVESTNTSGIIPARAGFTPVGVGAPAGPGDHPRSRGVYPAQGGGAQRKERIIPARAGFTRPARRPPRTRGDHPRSRGVYDTSRTRRSTRAGSSPLARGLPPSSPRRGRAGRIIPARAGFTDARLQEGRQDRDHPRSRGVYTLSSSSRVSRRGSSPLARGLHQAHLRPGGRGGDHPRSRGVYDVNNGPLKALEGSSPLARGLLPKRARERLDAGIIPARAGFTWGAAVPPSSPRDHPRSRGVYLHVRKGDNGPVGSSPLARGLLRVDQVHDAGPGIIPARAGFTLADPWNPNEPVLYQTPAAFTADPGPAPPSCGSAVVVPRWTTTPSGA